MGPSLAELEAERSRLYAELAAMPDVRRGSVTTNWRRCGKPNCRCATPAHPGHGPRHLWTRSVVGGPTRGRQIAPGAELDKVRAEVAAYQRFAALVDALVEVNEQICEGRPIRAFAGAHERSGTGPEQGGSSTPSGPSSRPS